MDEILGLDAVTQADLMNATGQPAISLPFHWNAQELPIEVQLVAPLGGEAPLLQVAAQLEEARPSYQRRPPIHG